MQVEAHKIRVDLTAGAHRPHADRQYVETAVKRQVSVNKHRVMFIASNGAAQFDFHLGPKQQHIMDADRCGPNGVFSSEAGVATNIHADPRSSAWFWHASQVDTVLLRRTVPGARSPTTLPFRSPYLVEGVPIPLRH